MSKYLTTAEVAERLRTSPSTIRYWRMTGYLPIGTPFGRRVLYDDDALADWERERAANDAAERRREPSAAVG
jgi:excisionase family DNA binding protein